MRLYYLELKNYIGIYNGTGKEVVTIDFSKCINQITVIKGDNGSGKSSLFKAIHPFTDSNYYLIPGKDAHKYISYILNDGSILEIQYEYPIDDNGNRKSSQCFIHYNGKELNLNHNVNSGKETICSILDIDYGFLTLAQLSSDDRGLADKTPSERKKFINKKISELDAFNEIYKKISKKSSQLKNVIESIDTKLKSIGNIKNVQTNIKLWTNQLVDLENQRTSMIVDMSKIQVKMDSLYEGIEQNPKEKYVELENRIKEVKYNISKLENKIDTSISDNDRIQLEKEVSNTEVSLESMKKNYLSIHSSISETNSKIETLSIKRKSLGSIELISDYKKAIENIKNKQLRFNRLCNRNIDWETISKDEYRYIVSLISKIPEFINRMKSTYPLSVIEDACSSLSYTSNYNKNELVSMEDALSKMNSSIKEQNFFKEQSKDVSLIPNDCMHTNDCPFVKAMVKAHDSILSDDDYEVLLYRHDELEKDIEAYQQGLYLQDESIKCFDERNKLFSSNGLFNDLAVSVMKKFNVKVIQSPNDIPIAFNALCRDNVSKWYWIDIDFYKELENTFIESKSYQKDIDELEKNLSSIMENKDLYDFITTELEELSTKKTSLQGEYNNAYGMYQKSLDVYDANKQRLVYINKQIEYNTQYNTFKDTQDKLQKEYNEFHANYELYCKLSDSLDEYNIRMNDLGRNKIPELTKIVDDAKYKTVLYNDYVKEYNRYRSEFEKIETIKYCCSPTTGIQTIYMEMYMNNIIAISNQLLSMFFNNEFVLQPFIINEKEFRIPVMGSGILNDDISSMSTSQVCMISMIISFALLSKSSSIYNIIKMDELDGGLDTNNRIAFFNVLSTLMNQLRSDQCLMISHNTELNTRNMDIIVLKNSDPNLSTEGNIIYSLE